MMPIALFFKINKPATDATFVLKIYIRNLCVDFKTED